MLSHHEPGGHYIYGLAVSPTDPNTAYAATYGAGVQKTTDGGATWVAVNSGTSDPSTRTVAIEPSAPDTVYLGTQSAGVFVTTDGGGSWTTMNVGLTNTQVYALTISSSGKTIYAGTCGGGVFDWETG